MLADKLGEEFVRNVLAIWREYLYLFAEDQDVAYRDERTWPFLVLDVSTHALERRGGKRTRCSSG